MAARRIIGIDEARMHPAPCICASDLEPIVFLPEDRQDHLRRQDPGGWRRHFRLNPKRRGVAGGDALVGRRGGRRRRDGLLRRSRGAKRRVPFDGCLGRRSLRLGGRRGPMQGGGHNRTISRRVLEMRHMTRRAPGDRHPDQRDGRRDRRENERGRADAKSRLAHGLWKAPFGGIIGQPPSRGRRNGDQRVLLRADLVREQDEKEVGPGGRFCFPSGTIPSELACRLRQRLIRRRVQIDGMLPIDDRKGGLKIVIHAVFRNAQPIDRAQRVVADPLCLLSLISVRGVLASRDGETV